MGRVWVSSAMPLFQKEPPPSMIAPVLANGYGPK
jgi:hypothetical protein